MSYRGLTIAAAGLVMSAPLFAAAAPLSTVDGFRIAQRDAKKIFGADREDTIFNDALLHEAITGAMGSGHDIVDIAPSYAMVHGCRPHSCPERSAVIIDKVSHQVVAAGLLHFNCRLAVLESDYQPPAVNGAIAGPQNKCDKEPTLAIFVVRRANAPANLRREPELVQLLRSWGKDANYVRETIKVKEIKRSR